MGLRDIRLSDLIDCIFPMLEGENAQTKNDREEQESRKQEEVKSLVKKLPSDKNQLKEYLESVEKLVEKEESRRTSVDARLTSIFGLTSIAATVVLTALFAMATGSMPLSQGVSKWMLVLGCFFLAFQLFVALHAAIKGLSRASYSSDTAVDLLPSDKMSHTNFLRHCISNKFDMLKQHQDVNNKKVDRMAVAHCAVRNFLFGLLIMACIASWIALEREPPKEAVVCSKTLTEFCAAHANPTATTRLAPGYEKQEPLIENDEFSANELLLPYVAFSIGIALIMVGLCLLFFQRHWLGVALTIGGLALSLFGGNKLELVGLKFDKLIGKLELSLSMHQSAMPRKILLTRIVTLGPFPPGEHKLNQEAVLSCMREAFKPYSDIPISGWQIIGRVDKHQLRADHATIYGSNQSLAMARAVWVADNALSLLPSFDPETAVISIGGARNVGTKVDDSELQLDRAVDIYVLLDREIPRTPLAAPPSTNNLLCHIPALPSN